jgi:hypothetical protein
MVGQKRDFSSDEEWTPKVNLRLLDHGDLQTDGTIFQRQARKRWKKSQRIAPSTKASVVVLATNVPLYSGTVQERCIFNLLYDHQQLTRALF